jgi:Winged helix-turn helix
MSRRARVLSLSESERQTLEQARDHHPTPYMRERAAALLRIAAGEAAYHVAMAGVLRARDPDTLYTWLGRYEREGLAGLFNHRQGRGFPPSAD